MSSGANRFTIVKQPADPLEIQMHFARMGLPRPTYPADVLAENISRERI